MLGLEDYSSSSDEERQTRLSVATDDDGSHPISSLPKHALRTSTSVDFHSQSKCGRNAKGVAHPPRASSVENGAPQYSTATGPIQGSVQGPARGPFMTDAESDQHRPSMAHIPESATSYQGLVHSLTLPPVPKVTMPPSPPGSPRPSTSAKVERFLHLKHQGTHFNARLESSAALRNPGLLSSLTDYAGIDKEYGQYANTLPVEVAFIAKGGFPKEAYAEELAKVQQEGQRRREEERRQISRMEFVPAKLADSYESSEFNGGREKGHRNAAERVMAGLEKNNVAPHKGRREGTHKSRFDVGAERRRKRFKSPTQ